MFTRDQVLARLRATLASGSPIIGAGAGTGISAKFVEARGADLILIYNSGKYRMTGHGSNAGLLPIGDPMERLPTEVAIESTVRSFKSVAI